MKKVMLILLLSAALGVSAEEPPCLIVRLTDSSEQSVKISEFGKLSFESSEMLLTYKNLASISYPVSTVSKIYFQNIASTDIRQSVEEKISIYPNPAADKIRLNNINTECAEITIYTLAGVQVLNCEVRNSDYIDVSALQPGFYIIKVNNHVLKFRKL